MSSREVIVFGGSFNPPTVAHEAIIEACLEKPGFDEVWVLPSGERTDKQITATAEDRLAMLECMRQQRFDDSDRLRISDFELNLPAPTQTVRTVGALACAYPQSKFWFVYGSDSYAAMPSWRGGEVLRDTLPVLVVAREGCPLPPESERVKHLIVPEIAIDVPVSSTEVRNRTRAHLPIAQLVCGAVGRYIESRHLYA